MASPRERRELLPSWDDGRLRSAGPFATVRSASIQGGVVDDSSSSLADLLTLATSTPRQLVAAINARLSSQGRERLRLDPTTAYSWARRGFRPHPPIPDIAAAALSERLGFRVDASHLRPGRDVAEHQGRTAAGGLALVSHMDDLVQELMRSSASSAQSSPSRPTNGVKAAAKWAWKSWAKPDLPRSIPADAGTRACSRRWAAITSGCRALAFAPAQVGLQVSGE